MAHAASRPAACARQYVPGVWAAGGRVGALRTVMVSKEDLEGQPPDQIERDRMVGTRLAERANP